MLWLWRAAAALLAAADSAAVRAAAAAGCTPHALKAGLGTALAVVALHRLLAGRRATPRLGGAALHSADALSQAPPGALSRPAGVDAARGAALPSAATQPATATAASRITLATAGVLFVGSPEALLECPPPLVAPAVAALAALASVADVYLITQLAPGNGAAAAEAAAREALTAAGLLGTQAGAVPPHKALFCTTHVGRIALVRQVRAPASLARSASRAGMDRH